jgi:hypothetical protein
VRQQVSALLDHVRRLEPHISESTLMLDLRVGPAGEFHRSGHITEGSSAPGPRPVGFYQDLRPCSSCLPDDELFGALLQAIDDRNLNRAAQILHELTIVERDLGRRSDDVVSATQSDDVAIAVLDNMATRFLTDSIILADSKERLLANPVLPAHNACRVLADELIARLRSEIAQKLNSAENAALLRRRAIHEFGIEEDDTPTLVQVAPVMEFPSFGDTGFLDDADGFDDHSVYLPLTLRVMFSHESLLEESLVTMPAWAALSIKLVKPNMIRSSLHRGLPGRIAETATALWSPSTDDLYHQLDHCITAARRLVEEDIPEQSVARAALGKTRQPRPSMP